MEPGMDRGRAQAFTVTGPADRGVTPLGTVMGALPMRGIWSPRPHTKHRGSAAPPLAPRGGHEPVAVDRTATPRPPGARGLGGLAVLAQGLRGDAAR
jgi:hypothetical protein